MSSARSGKELATLAGGCFWCLEAIFSDLPGIERVESGYSGGTGPHPTYEQVCSGTTGHAEVVHLTFDPTVISFKEILKIFFAVHDPTTLNRQGADVGTQYRSAIFYHTPEQQEVAGQVMKEMTAEAMWDAPVVTEVTPFMAFYRAEDDHKDYFKRNPEQPYCRVVIAPKITKFRQHYLERVKKSSG